MPPWLAPLVLLLLALADRLQPAEGRFKMSMAGAGRKSDAKKSEAWCSEGTRKLLASDE